MPFLESIQKLYWIFFSPPPPLPRLPPAPSLRLQLTFSYHALGPGSPPMSLCVLLHHPFFPCLSRGWVEYESSSDSCEAAWKCHSRGGERSVWDKGGLDRALPVVYLMFCQSHANLPWTLTRDLVNNVQRLRYREHWSGDGVCFLSSILYFFFLTAIVNVLKCKYLSHWWGVESYQQRQGGEAGRPQRPTGDYISKKCGQPQPKWDDSQFDRERKKQKQNMNLNITVYPPQLIWCSPGKSSQPKAHLAEKVSSNWVSHSDNSSSEIPWEVLC